MFLQFYVVNNSNFPTGTNYMTGKQRRSYNIHVIKKSVARFNSTVSMNTVKRMESVAKTLH